MPDRKREVHLSARADFDRESIILYGLTTWGEGRTASYVSALDDAIDNLSQYPEIGRSRSDLDPGVRSRPVGEHVVYYVIERTEIRVARILHGKEDATAAAGIYS